MSKSTIIGIVIFLIATGIFIVAFFALDTFKSPAAKTNSLGKPILTTDPSQSKSESVALPFPPNDHSVLFAFIRYTFVGKLVTINTVPTGKELITDITSPNLPPFIVTQNTDVFFLNPVSLQGKPTDASSLKEGQSLRILSNYGIKTKKWAVATVYILTNDAIPTATPGSTSPLNPDSGVTK